MTRHIMVAWLLLLLLVPGQAAVLPDGSQLPPSDPDAPTITLPPAHPGGSPVTVSAVGPAGQGASSPLPGSTTPPTSSRPGTATGGTGGKMGAAANGTPPKPSPPGNGPRFTLPNGQPVPWSLIALAVLLFLFSVCGGVYFYQSRDD